jgi:hypothetical protein
MLHRPGRGAGVRRDLGVGFGPGSWYRWRTGVVVAVGVGAGAVVGVGLRRKVGVAVDVNVAVAVAVALGVSVGILARAFQCGSLPILLAPVGANETEVSHGRGGRLDEVHYNGPLASIYRDFPPPDRPLTRIR